jgi:hypothetical protein
MRGVECLCNSSFASTTVYYFQVSHNDTMRCCPPPLQYTNCFLQENLAIQPF